jgi:ribonuclease Z
VDGAPIWEVEDEGDVTVHAAPMSHGVPCVGYVVTEENKPGRLRPDLVQPIINRNREELKKIIKNPMKMMAVIKNMPEGSSYVFPDGTVLQQSDVVESPREGRKIVILGDTLNPRAIAGKESCLKLEEAHHYELLSLIIYSFITGLAQGADVVIHEATNAFLSGVDNNTNLKEVTSDAMRHGHSTPSMAGAFAKEVNAKRLLLNHFSSRYKGDQTLDSMSIMTRIEQQAIKASNLAEEKVAAAWDFMILPVHSADEEGNVSLDEEKV